MKNEKTIFGFFTEGDNARVDINGTGEEVVAGLVMLLNANPSMELMMDAAMKVYKNMPDDLAKMMNTKEDE